MIEYIVTCSCGKSFNAADQIGAQIENRLKDEFNARWKQEQKKLEEQRLLLDQQKADLDAQVQQKAAEQAQIQINAIKELTAKQINDQKLEADKRAEEKINLAHERIKSQFEAESVRLKSEKEQLEAKAHQAVKLEEELRVKDIQYKSLEEQKNQEVELAKKRATEAARLDLELEKQKLEHQINLQKINLEAERDALTRKLEKESQEKLEQERTKIAAEIEAKVAADAQKIADESVSKLRSEYEEALRLKDQQLTQQAKLAQNMANVNNRRSQQVQGESFEQHVRRVFSEALHPNPVSDIKTGGGVTGADLRIQYTAYPSNLTFPVIVELKSTKLFQPTFIDKLKEDAAKIPKALPILLTKSMPKDSQEPFLILKDILVVRYDEDGHFLPTVKLAIHEYAKLLTQRSALTNLDDKMEQTYQLLTSDGFKTKLYNVVSFFDNRKKFLDEEKKFFTRKWKNEEKELNAIYGAAVDIRDNINYIQQGIQSISEMGANLLGEATGTEDLDIE